MGTHPIFESDFDCLTEMMEGGVGIKLGMINSELLQDYLEVWWTILSCAIALILYVTTYKYVRRHNKIHEFLTLIWPLLLSMTSWHGLRTLPLYLIVIIYSRFQWVGLDKSQLGHKTENSIISTFRVYILIFTIIAILAVDFQIFPPHFGKTHMYGVSVMDIGVGAFVASNAMASSDAKSNDMKLNSLILTKTLPLLVVGIIRWGSTAAIGYHVDATEYGVHWNFFFSLFVVKVAGPILIRSFRRIPPLFLGIILIIGYELILQKTGLDDIILDRNHERNTFFLQNKEGICSSIGLTALYLIYVQIGRHLLPLIEHGNILKRTITLMICLWVLVLIFNVFGFVASRRMANLGYVLWITAMTPSFLSFCIIGDNLRCEYAIKTPKLIHDINLTQLPVFLLANIFTGLTNVLIDTRAQPVLVAHFVMMIYLGTMCWVGYGIANNQTILQYSRRLFSGRSNHVTSQSLLPG